MLILLSLISVVILCAMAATNNSQLIAIFLGLCAVIMLLNIF